MTTKTAWTKTGYQTYEKSYQLTKAFNGCDDGNEAVVTIMKEDEGWCFCSSEDWESYDIGDGQKFSATLKEAKEKAMSGIENDIWSNALICDESED